MQIQWHLLLASLLVCAPAHSKTTRRYNFTITYQWSNGDGHGRPSFAINGQTPGPLIEADEGDEIEVFVDNQLGFETTMHWCVHALPSIPFHSIPFIHSFLIPPPLTDAHTHIGMASTRSTGRGTTACPA